MKRVIITGGSGFVGANLTRRLLEDGYEVHLLVRQGYSPWRIEAMRAHLFLHEVDFLDVEALSRIVCSIKPEWIFHLAVYGGYSWQTDLQCMVQMNIIGTINLVQACLRTGFEVFINTGTSSEYGFKTHAPSETEWLEPNSCYAVTKAAQTQFCRYTAQSRGVQIVTLRLYSVYGPYEEPTRLMPTLILHGLEGRLPPLVSPEISHDFVYVEDVVEAYIQTATRTNQELGAIYNVGTGVQTPLRDVVEIARRVMGIAVEPKWGSMPGRQQDTNTWVADNRRIQEKISWHAQYTFEQGFRRMLAWFCDNPEMAALYKRRK